MRKLVEKFSMTFDNDSIIMITMVIVYNYNDADNNDNDNNNDNNDNIIEQDQEVGHGLKAHHPERRDVLVELLNATHLLLWERFFQ